MWANIMFFTALAIATLGTLLSLFLTFKKDLNEKRQPYTNRPFLLTGLFFLFAAVVAKYLGL